MKFEVLKKSHLKKRNIIIGVMAVLLISAIVLNFTRAKYRTTADIPIASGTINYSLADLNIVGLYINGEEATELDSSKNYTLDTAKSTCTYKDGSTIDNLTLNYNSETKSFSISPYTTKGTKCTLYFDEYHQLLVDAIKEAYQNNTTTLAYDETVDNNLRYIGKDPNNYVLFNDELWRIIGIFDKNTHEVEGTELVKIIRNESIGNYSWDNKPSGTGSSTSQYGSNDWSDSAIQVVLNEGAYWNRTSGTCPSDQNGATTNCDFSNAGLTKRAKAMIETVTWKLGGNSTYNDVTASMFYERERGTTVYTGRPTEWVGEVGLMYPSDYGYATSGGSTTDRATCLATELYNWMSSTGFSDCYNNDWLFNGSLQWTLTPRSSSSDFVFRVSYIGYLSSANANSDDGIRPSIYLKSNIAVTSGDGSENNPYILTTYNK